jgi:hypothetical protein
MPPPSIAQIDLGDLLSPSQPYSFPWRLTSGSVVPLLAASSCTSGSRTNAQVQRKDYAPESPKHFQPGWTLNQPNRVVVESVSVFIPSFYKAIGSPQAEIQANGAHQGLDEGVVVLNGPLLANKVEDRSDPVRPRPTQICWDSKEHIAIISTRRKAHKLSSSLEEFGSPTRY